MTASFDIGGLSVHIRSIRSSFTYMLPCFSFAISESLLPHAAFTTLPSKPITPPSERVSFIYSSTVGTPSSPILKSFTVVSLSCAAACTKYLPSVHNPASSIVMTAVPAEPVKPVIYLRALKCSPTYSDS